MRAIFLAKNTPSAITALEYLIHCDIQVVAVVTQPSHSHQSLATIVKKLNIPLTTDKNLYALLERSECSITDHVPLEQIDLVLSFLFWKRIRKPLIQLPRIGCLNFHPAPLPEMRGVSGYSWAIYEHMPTWGVSAHFVDETFDTGDLITVHRFTITPEQETAFSLQQTSHRCLVKLFKDVIDMVIGGQPLPRTPQGPGRYVSRKDFDTLCQIHPTDTMEEIDRKVRACWYPPFGGATITIQGQPFTLVNDGILLDIFQRLLH